MDFGQRRLQQQEAARLMTYQNSGYQFERRNMKSLIVDVTDEQNKYPLTDVSDFSVDLFEPLIVDKLSDIYLDNFTTYNSLLCDKHERSMFSLRINEFNVNSNCASSGDGQNIFNHILIPNENDDVDNVHSAVIHKGKKMNYVCQINPGKLTKITGKISSLDGSSMFTTVHTADTSHDSGRIRHIKMKSSTKFTENIPEDTSGTIDEGSFVNAYYTHKGSRDLYFYPKTGYTDSDAVDELDSSEFTGTGIGGITNSISTPFETGTYRRGGYPRFIAEFLIVARE
tara:strand:- start:963 stop:1814 length:852 start_codon:yes stop_codon:yes gene_type:complete